MAPVARHASHIPPPLKRLAGRGWPKPRFRGPASLHGRGRRRRPHASMQSEVARFERAGAWFRKGQGPRPMAVTIRATMGDFLPIATTGNRAWLSVLVALDASVDTPLSPRARCRNPHQRIFAPQRRGRQGGSAGALGGPVSAVHRCTLHRARDDSGGCGWRWRIRWRCRAQQPISGVLRRTRRRLSCDGAIRFAIAPLHRNANGLVGGRQTTRRRLHCGKRRAAPYVSGAKSV